MIQNRKGIHEISLARCSKLKGLPIIVPASLSIERNISKPKRLGQIIVHLWSCMTNTLLYNDGDFCLGEELMNN